MAKFADLQAAEYNLTTAITLGDISFYASYTNPNKSPELILRRFGSEGRCKFASLSTQEIEALAEEFNIAIKPVIDKWQKRAVQKAKLLAMEVES